MNVAVLGAGTAGREIAQVCARGGNDVMLHAREASAAMDALDDVTHRLEAAGADAATDRLEATTGLHAAVGDALVVIETATDDATPLQRRFADIEEHTARETLVTTSRPTLSVTAAAAGLRHPDRALGLYIHQPLDTRLVEVVVTEQTAAGATDLAGSFVDTLDAVPAVVTDTPGFASPRLALALETEAMWMVEEGVAGVETADTVLTRGYGHQTGPLELADRVGLDGRLDTLEYLADALGERYRPPELLYDRVAAGKTGASAGEGFYLWEDGEPTEPAVDGPDFPGDVHAADIYDH